MAVVEMVHVTGTLGFVVDGSEHAAGVADTLTLLVVVEIAVTVESDRLGTPGPIDVGIALASTFAAEALPVLQTLARIATRTVQR